MEYVKKSLFVGRAKLSSALRVLLLVALLSAGLLAGLLTLLLTGCASLPVSQREAPVEALLYRLHSEDVSRAVELTRLPFLLDGEILTTERDAELLWENLKAIPDFLESPEILSIREAYPSDYTEFRDSSELRVFFDRALPENPSLVEIETPVGRFLLLLTGKKLGLPEIAGLKGPM